MAAVTAAVKAVLVTAAMVASVADKVIVAVAFTLVTLVLWKYLEVTPVNAAVAVAVTATVAGLLTGSRQNTRCDRSCTGCHCDYYCGCCDC